MIESISWQPVKYDNSDVGFRALLPGSPISGIGNGNIYSYSEHEGTVYEIHCSLGGRYSPLPTERLFLDQVENAFENFTVTPLSVDQPNVKYCVDMVKENQSIRLISSSNQLYWVIVKGEDQSLTSTFFNSVQILR